MFMATIIFHERANHALVLGYLVEAIFEFVKAIRDISSVKSKEKGGKGTAKTTLYENA